MNKRYQIFRIFIPFAYCLIWLVPSSAAPNEIQENQRLEVTRHTIASGLAQKPVEVTASESKKMVFSVEGIPVLAEFNGDLTIRFGSQRLESSSLKTSWIPINDNYGFSGLETIDFDLDGIEDAVARFSWGGFGSGWANGYLCVSSRTRKAYLYESFSGNNFWNNRGGRMPEIRKPYFLLEIPDFMPRFQVNIEGEALTHPECISFLFTHVWNGDGFSYQAIREFYQGILPIVEARLAEAEYEPYPNPEKREFYRLIVRDYRKVAQGLPISSESRKSTAWKLLKKFKPESGNNR